MDTRAIERSHATRNRRKAHCAGPTLGKLSPKNGSQSEEDVIQTKGSVIEVYMKVTGDIPEKIGVHLCAFYDGQNFALDDIKHILPDGSRHLSEAKLVLGGHRYVCRGGREPDLEELFGSFEGTIGELIVGGHSGTGALSVWRVVAGGGGLDLWMHELGV